MSKFGGTALIFVERGAKTNGKHYSNILQPKPLRHYDGFQLNAFIFQQGSTLAHRALDTTELQRRSPHSLYCCEDDVVVMHLTHVTSFRLAMLSGK